LVRTQLLDESKAELWRWGTKRFWWLFLVLSVVSLLGGSVLIRGVIRETVRERVGEILDHQVKPRLDEARADAADCVRAGVLAKSCAQRAKGATEEAQKQAEEYGKTLAALRQKATEVDAMYLALQQALAAESANLRASSDRKMEDLARRLARTEELMEDVVGQGRASPQVLAAYREQVAQIQTAALTAQQRFAENAQYRVAVYFKEGVGDLGAKAAEKLTRVGFKASAMDIARAEKFLSPVQAVLPSPPRTVKAPGAGGLAFNVITYTPDVKSKAAEVRELLTSLPEIGKLEQLSREVFVEKWGASFIAQLPPVAASETNEIEVYLMRRR